MISHNEAQALISARQDQVLDPLAEQELNAHLATCDSCRAFARSTESLTQGLRTLPYMPASPAVRRAVLDRVKQGRSPFARFAGMFDTAPGPALSTLAIIALVALLSVFALNRFVLQDRGNGDNGQQQLASAPTEQAPSTETPTFTVTPEPTATDEPVNLMAGETPTATTAPTETPKPTDAPTQAPTQAPTETTAPTDAPAPTKEPTREPTTAPTTEPTTAPTLEPTQPPADLTIASKATEMPTEAPTETAAPTATTAPTPEPTSEPTEAPTRTPTEEPTQEPTEAPTETPTEEAAPQIVPIDGSQPVDSSPDGGDSGTGQGPSTGEKPTRSAPTIEPVGGQTVTGQEGQIEPIQPSETPGAETPVSGTGAAAETPVAEPETVADLEAASEPYQDIAGDPSGRLLLTNEGRMVFGDQPHAPQMVTPAGRTLETIDADGGTAVALCDEAGTCTDVSSQSRDGAATDTPLGIIGADVIYARVTDGSVEYRRSAVEGDAVIADEVLYTGGAEDAPRGPVYFESDRLWIPTAGGNWVMLGDTEGSLLPGSGVDPQLVRFAGTGDNLLIGYVANGRLVVADATSPASPILTLPFSGVDFDIAPGGQQVVISTGDSIDVYAIDGTLVTSYRSEGVRTGTVLWLNSGIVYAIRDSAALYQILETGN